MGEKDQVRGVPRRPAPVRSRRVGQSGGGAEVIDLAAWKRQRKAQVAGNYGLVQRVSRGYESDGPA